MAYFPLPLHDRTAPVAARGRQAEIRLGLLGKALATVRLWQGRIREREALARLSEIELRDLRFSPSDIAHEIRKPFWRE